MITYYKLLDTLNRRGMTRDQLRIAIGASANTITANLLTNRKPYGKI